MDAGIKVASGLSTFLLCSFQLSTERAPLPQSRAPLQKRKRNRAQHYTHAPQQRTCPARAQPLIHRFSRERDQQCRRDVPAEYRASERGGRVDVICVGDVVRQPHEG